MTKEEIFDLVQSLVQTFGTVDAALKAVHDTPFPRKKRHVKKILQKWLRTYNYFHRGGSST